MRKAAMQSLRQAEQAIEASDFSFPSKRRNPIRQTWRGQARHFCVENLLAVLGSRLTPFAARLMAVLLISMAGAVRAESHRKEVWACISEKMVGIEEGQNDEVTAGTFKVKPEKFLLTVEFGSPFGTVASFNPEFMSPVEEDAGQAQVISTFRSSNGINWLLFRGRDLKAARSGSDEGRPFRLGYTWGGASYLLRGRCVPFS
jgi:hypothetical protein